MPNPSRPEIDSWVSFLKEKVGKLDERTYFVGHRVGCQAIMRLLEKSEGKALDAFLLPAGSASHFKHRKKRK